MTSPWRLIPLLEAPGQVQMALDWWLLQQHRQDKHPPTLRFYTWSPAAISLGYHQRHYPAFWNELTWQGQPLELVRRPTGGRAVLHQGDLTYMVVTSDLPGTRRQAYQTICQFLQQGWRSLGSELHYGSAGRGYIHHPNCFATATGADLVDAQGNKRIGSAQLRQGKVILQHGSLLLAPDSPLFRQVFSEPPGQNLILQGHSGDSLIPLLIESLTAAASSCFDIELVTEPLSEAEWQEVQEIINDSACSNRF